MFTLIAAAALSCIAIDGDTLRCGDERVRLLAIDAPELAGHCRKGRKCVPGDPRASKASLAEMISGRQVQLERFGKDRYGRTLALARAGGRDLGCEQLRRGHAIFVSRWDVAGRSARSCGTSSRTVT